MSEYVVELPESGAADECIRVIGCEKKLYGYELREEIVRCRACKHYSEHEWIIATDVSDVCHFWHGGPTKVEPDGFCAWGERKEADEWLRN